jgi:hypothetical protein
MKGELFASDDTSWIKIISPQKAREDSASEKTAGKDRLEKKSSEPPSRRREMSFCLRQVVLGTTLTFYSNRCI